MGSGTFYRCKYLSQIEFQDDSKLQFIGKSAFCIAGIKEIKIPSQVEMIGDSAFQDCEMLRNIEISMDSNLRTIGRLAFSNTSIESISIPPKLAELKEDWCQNTLKLNNVFVSDSNPYFRANDNKYIIGKSSNEQSNFDCLIFCVRNIEKITIPSYIEHICSHAFEKCVNLTEVEFPDDSKLQTIGKSAFFES